MVSSANLREREGPVHIDDGGRLLAFIDRSNIGNARIDGLATDLKLTGNKFNVALVVFYVPYIAVDVPSNWIVRHCQAGYYLPILLICWGMVSTFLGFTKSYGGLTAARFFLGLCEGGLLGGMIVYLAMFYRRHQMLYRIGLFYCAAPLSGPFGGLLATGLAKIKQGGYNGRSTSHHLVVPTDALYRMAMDFLRRGHDHSLFWTHCHMLHGTYASSGQVLDCRGAGGRAAQDEVRCHGATTEEDVGQERFNWHWIRMALLSPNTWFCSLAWFFLLIPLYLSLPG